MANSDDNASIIALDDSSILSLLRSTAINAL